MAVLFKANLCKCNNCELVLIDQNAQIGAKEFEVFSAPDAHRMDSFGNEVADMSYIPDRINPNEHFWACPVCDSDEYLVDYEQVVR